jgi:uncharacterized protein (TIGR02466 family)
MKYAFFNPLIMGIDTIPDDMFERIKKLAEKLHERTDLNDAGNNELSVRGGQQIQVLPNDASINVDWLVEFLEEQLIQYIQQVKTQSMLPDMDYVDVKVTSIWTIKQNSGEYQAMHNHPAGHLSGNMYIDMPTLAENSTNIDSNILFKFPVEKDVTKFILQDGWCYRPEAKNILIFPSYVSHLVYPWKGTGNRTVMAFDAILIPKAIDGTKTSN